MKKIILLFAGLIFFIFENSAQTFLMKDTTVYSCSGNFYDAGGSGTIGGPYGANSYQMTFNSSSGKRLHFNFSAGNFSLPYNSIYSDELIIYDGPSASYPVIGVYTKSDNPGIITSTGSSLTFYFDANSSGTAREGWIATFSCITDTLDVFNLDSNNVVADSGVFYDSGGPVNAYSNNENIIQTFCSSSGLPLKFSFNPNSFYLYDEGDSLFIYNGDDTLSPPIAVYTTLSLIDIIISTDSCITFKFKSNSSGISSGWQAIFETSSEILGSQVYSISPGIRYTCSGTFCDAGGLSGTIGGSYGASDAHTTFCSDNDEKLKCNFLYLNLPFNNYYSDELKIYDGVSKYSPLIGTYMQNTSPGLIISTGTCLTFYFNAHSSGTPKNGWAADISCDSSTVDITDFTKSINDNILIVYPNPANDIINISRENNEIITLKIYNIMGSLIQTNELNKARQQIDIKNLCNGIYTVELKSNDSTNKQKLIIQK